MFEAPFTALLEVHCGMMASAILSDTIPCERLKLHDIDQSELMLPFPKAAQVKEEAEQEREHSETIDLRMMSSSVASR